MRLGFRIVSVIAIVCLLAGAAAYFACAGCLKPRYPDGEWSGACTESESGFTMHPASARAKKMLRTALDEDKGAGISAAVVVDGAVVWKAAVGRANAKQALSTNARMRIGSVSKVFTAVIAARLVERDALDVDASIRDYVPELPDSFAPISIRHLATHTSGIRQYDFANLEDSNNTVYHESLAGGFSRHLRESLLGKPGERYVYSSIAFNLLGIAVERASGMTYSQALEEMITRPLDLTSTGTDDSQQRIDCRPSFYSVLFARLRLPTLWRDNSDLFPSGGLLSTATDLARFGDEVLRGSLLLPETRAMFVQKARLTDGSEIERGFGWEVRTADDGSILWVGHGGTVNGAYASLRYYPKDRMTVAGAANYDIQLSAKRAAFFRAIREEIPALIAGEDGPAYRD